MAATRGTSSSVSSNPGAWAVARSTKRATAPDPDQIRPVVHLLGRQRKRGNPVDDSAFDAQAAKGWSPGGPDHGAVAHDGVGQGGTAVEHLLAVVEDDHPALGREDFDQRICQGLLARLLADTEVTGARSGHQGGIGDGGQLREPYAVCGLSGRTARPTSMANRVLPTPPEPVRVTRRLLPRSLTTSAISVSRPTRLDTGCVRLVGLARVVVISAPTCTRSGGKSADTPSTSSWKTSSGRSRSFKEWRPSSTNFMPFGRRSRTTSAVDRDTTTWPPCAVAPSRAMRFTAGPK